MIIGTAGHIDHGKSALITALTGRTMDRLQEERRRGITIDLNFAPFVVPGGPTAGIIDVPGHEDFIRTMVAGASGVDLVLLVIDAAEGPRPQTYEHLDILDQLGVQRGIPVITKTDTVEAEWLALMVDEVTDLLQLRRTHFEAPMLTSAKTGEGIAALRARLEQFVTEWRPLKDADLFRMPIDRAFSLVGVGTVVTGTVWSGTISSGATVAILPGKQRGRVRSIEIFGDNVTEAHAGHRHAMVLSGVHRDDIGRGRTIVGVEDGWVETTALDVHLNIANEAHRAVTSRTRVRFHLGTTEVLARAYPRSPLPPGGSGMARLILEAPTVARGRDRFVLRSYSPMATIGGGIVLDPQPARRARWFPGIGGTDSERVGAIVRRRHRGMPSAIAPHVVGSPLPEALKLLAEQGDLQELDQTWFHRSVLTRAAERALELVHAHHQAQPAEAGMSQETLRQALGVPDLVVAEVLRGLTEQGTLRVEQGIVANVRHQPSVAGGTETIDRIVGTIGKEGLTPPTLTELKQRLGGEDTVQGIQLAVHSGRLVQVERDRWFATDALDRFVVMVREVASHNEGTITPAGVRERTGLSRRFLIPLLEWTDRQGITRREGNDRFLCS